MEYTVQPGTYEFRLTKPSLAAAEFPLLTTGQLQSLYTAWSYNSPWITDYLVFDTSAATNASEAQLFAGGVVSMGYGSANDAFQAAVMGNYINKIIVGPGGRYTGTPATHYTFAAPETLLFAVPDYGLGDNSGGISIVISPTSSAGLLGDYNENNEVDAADYTAWRDTLTAGSTTLANDPTPGTVDESDFLYWRTHFGETLGNGAGAGAARRARTVDPGDPPFGNAVDSLSTGTPVSSTRYHVKLVKTNHHFSTVY